MHREIMKPPRGKVVDYLQGNRMDNTRANLRVCTPAENNRNRAKHKNNSSRFIGVYYNKQRGKWEVLIRIEGKYKFIGFFDDELEAARAYDRSAVELLGEFARLNSPDEWPPDRRQAHLAQSQNTAKQEKRDANSRKKRKEAKKQR